jgi:hypothetical protein
MIGIILRGLLCLVVETLFIPVKLIALLIYMGLAILGKISGLYTFTEYFKETWSRAKPIIIGEFEWVKTGTFPEIES